MSKRIKEVKVGKFEGDEMRTENIEVLQCPIIRYHKKTSTIYSLGDIGTRDNHPKR